MHFFHRDALWNCVFKWLSLCMGITDKIEVSTIANVLHFQSFCFPYFFVFVVIVVTLSSLVTWQHKTIFWYATILPEKSTIDGKRATKSTSAGTHTVAQWLVTSNLDLRARRQKRKNRIWTITRAIVCCGLCGQLEQRYNNQAAVTNSIVRKLEKLVIVS